MLVRHNHPLGGRVVFAVLILVTGFVLSRSAAFPDWTDCPVVCKCKWTSGKKSALCHNAGLTTLPPSLDPDMQLLDLSGNQISAIESEVFKRASLLNLQKFFLRNGTVREIHPDAFKELRILVEVDLSDNLIERLEPNTFFGNERLRVLILNGNPIRVLESHQFPTLRHMRNLELQRCSLKEIHKFAFVQLSELESLKLNNNYLEFIDAFSISSLSKLKTLAIDNNNWRCDCRLREFRNWIMTRGPSRLYSVAQVCKAPARLESRRWEDIKPLEFACEPKVVTWTSNTQAEINGNVTLICSAVGDPEPELWWQFNGGPINHTRTEQPYSGALITHFSSPDTSESITTGVKYVERSSNLTIYNASETDAGEYTCFARNIAGSISSGLDIAVPRVFTATTLSQKDNWLIWMSLAGGGAAVLCASIAAVMLVLCLYGGSPRRRSDGQQKNKYQGERRGFGNHEKNFLNLSLTTMTGESVNGQASDPGSSTGAYSPGELELRDHRSIHDQLSATNVTIERLMPEVCTTNSIRALPTCTGIFPPPLSGFVAGLPPSGTFGNIFISVPLPHESSERCYPDLLDIPVHGVVNHVLEKARLGPDPEPSNVVSHFATLPRRTLRSADLGSPYDNMGPRVTATGSSTFSLTDLELHVSPTTTPSVIQPPPEFLSL